MINRQFRLVRRPSGMPVAEDFVLDETQLPALGDGQFLIQNRYASLDPAMRGWMDDRPSYVPPIPLESPVRASTVGVVVESRDPGFPVGRWVFGQNAIEEYSLGNPRTARLIDENAMPSVTNYLSVLGVAGVTAYLALELAEPRAGQNLLVSGAAGAVGSIVGQIAKIRGCRTIGIAGGAAKCARLLERYRYDAAIDYRGKDSDQLGEAISSAIPDGIDIHFENVGGIILDAALLRINQRARIILCGLISQYNGPPAPTQNLWQLIVKGARMEGFILTQHWDRVPDARSRLAEWVNTGELKVDEHIDEGIENALSAFRRLFEGTNEGKMILKLA